MARAIAICRCLTCGNEFEKINFCRNRKSADEWEAWAANTFDMCPDCYSKERARKEAEDMAAAGADSLPTLTGTEKQITWAETIRARVYLQAKKLLEQMKAAPDHCGEGAIDIVTAFYQAIATEDSAKTIIDCFADDLKCYGDDTVARLARHLWAMYTADDRKKIPVFLPALYSMLAARTDLFAEEEGRKAAAKEEIASLPKPQKPDVLSGHWNGKFYGRNEDTIYVDGKPVELTADQVAEIKDYQKKLKILASIERRIGAGEDYQDLLDKLNEQPEEPAPQPESKWLGINVNANQVEAINASYSKVFMPHNSDYNGFCFWHPTKLMRAGRNLSSIEIRFSRDYSFNLKKYGKGRYNKRTVLKEETVGYQEILEAFGCTDANITAPSDYAPAIIEEHHIPPTLDPDELSGDADASLIRKEPQ